MKLILLFMSLLAVVGAAATFGPEYDAAFFARSPEESAFDALVTPANLPDLPLSSRSMRELFETCAAVQQGLIYAFQPPETQGDVDRSCDSLARKALARSPTYGAAHTIVMLSARDDAAVTESLILSQSTSPRESWHAKLRLRKGIRLYGKATPALDAALEADIGFMVQTRAGRAWLAALYQSNPTARPVLVAVINRRPNEEQVSFLREVRNLGQN
ncbi:hypothetical protein [Pseudotabrizicola algicola]|uniref:Methanolan biosynthesis EpsI domain-containing protein n=1 Tax=Pseudotabrizicola algicola TaxID=2709381 RepID=A0A6B3RH19_9RHOB|nr:hypothetical protein [Pseudotabrizicola algicola]NEX45327.1 hypothetical protein [Pseudotabrizicola algicola]